MATIVAAHDLSGVGRCSLTTAISVLSAMGHHCCPLPTAILSQQTGLPGYSCLDFTPHLPAFLEGWRNLGLRPGLIFTGFLGGPEQPRLLAEFADAHPQARLVVDPVMGDGGKLYPCYDRDFVSSMAELAGRAHILTPNPTEFQLLAGRKPLEKLPEEAGLLEAARAMGGPRLEMVLITGAGGEGGYRNLLVDVAGGRVISLPCRHTGVSYNGSGDLFASVFTGCIASGMGLPDAAQTAAAFVTEVAEAMPDGCDPRYGLRFEGRLHSLATIEKGADSYGTR